MKFKYNVINSLNGKEETWTGLFPNLDAAMEWHQKYGVKWVARGKKLILRAAKNKERINL